MASILANCLKNFSPEEITLLISSIFLFAKGSYNADSKTTPTPSSKKEITPKNCVIELTSPLTSDPNEFNTSLGRINPHIMVVT